MVHENRHWGEIEHDPRAVEWAAYLELRPLIPPVISEAQRRGFVGTIVEARHPVVRSVRCWTLPLMNHLAISQIIEARSDEDALGRSMLSALGGLALTGKDIETLEFYQAHLAPKVVLVRDHESGIAGDGAPKISDQRYMVEGPIVTRAFDGAMAFARGLQHDMAELALL